MYNFCWGRIQYPLFRVVTTDSVSRHHLNVCHFSTRKHSGRPFEEENVQKEIPLKHDQLLHVIQQQLGTFGLSGHVSMNCITVDREGPVKFCFTIILLSLAANSIVDAL